MEERLFPHVRALDDPEQMEEERRLCYVGMTRARERLYLSNARRRHFYGQEQFNSPSRFLEDIPAELMEAEDEHCHAAGRGEHSATNGWNRSGRGRWDEAVALSEGAGRAESASPVPDNEVHIVPEGDGVFIGLRVRHAKFGPGTIRKIEGSGDNEKVIVWFDSGGPKKLLLRFAGLERI
jgi:ATP-dependent DNA helicase UvrD/PcrA